jgi:hypothetical protein
MRMYCRVAESVNDAWKVTAMEAIRALAPDERAGVVGFCRRLCELVEECEREDGEATPA